MYWSFHFGGCVIPTSIIVIRTCVGVLLRGEEGELHSKKDIIMTARQIVKESEEIVKMARIVANSCTDKRLKRVSVVCSSSVHNAKVSSCGDGAFAVSNGNCAPYRNSNVSCCLYLHPG